MGRKQRIRHGVPGFATLAVLTCVLAACSGSAGSGGSNGGTNSGGSPGASTGPASTPTAPTASAAAAGFVPITEPFDPGHPARIRPAPADCGSQPTTLAIEQCYTTKTENADAAIDAAQQAHYQSGSQAGQASILADDSAWLAAREPVCAKAFHSGGTIDGVNAAACLLDESTARLYAVQGTTPSQAKLKVTDNIDPSAFSWYTTPEGSRIAMVATQGDGQGGGIIEWVIIAGHAGFVVNAAQFWFQDGTFTDHGTPEGSSPTGHRVAPGAEFQFGVDYSHLSADPHGNGSNGGYVYVPGTPVASWGK